jgi:hypothetical protein
MRIVNNVAAVAGTAIALAFGAAGTLTASADQPSAKAFVDGIYQSYVGPEGSAYGVNLDTDDALRQWFAPELAQAIIADADAADARGEVPMLDGDPFVDAQEWKIDGFEDKVTETGPGAAEAVVTFDNYGRHEVITLDLVLLDGAWKVSEIDWGADEGTLGALVRSQPE